MIHQIFPLLSKIRLIIAHRTARLFARPERNFDESRICENSFVDVLESSVKSINNSNKHLSAKFKNRVADETEAEKAIICTDSPTSFALSGYLLQSLEAFRRAMALNPKDAWLILILHVVFTRLPVGTQPQTSAKGVCRLRIAEKHGAGNGDFLARLGECYFQYGERQRARQAFQKRPRLPVKVSVPSEV
jgi:tetratricopeptide (TPR) repeat protein